MKRGGGKGDNSVRGTVYIKDKTVSLCALIKKYLRVAACTVNLAYLGKMQIYFYKFQRHVEL